ncbi:hypothetical protein F5878DRAFT_264500 [Lentinula raphanica]|uniref:Uncharacterized protein n=1 Tax=Lentinula raphanica TaxID=153919 RepID=A0AA38UBV1_9AGAR|nr:hypothetical protein F5878DRAFT_264500 [Lentinula raphanica]
MLPSITSLFSTRALSVLTLATCFLGITVIARPIDQVGSGSTALQTSVEKNYHPEIVLQQYSLKGSNPLALVDGLVSFRIGPTETINQISTRQTLYNYDTQETKLGHLHFKDEMECSQALVRARIHATEWQSVGPDSRATAKWKYLFDALAYLIAAYNNVIDEETYKTWSKLEHKPASLLGDLGYESQVIALIVYYHTLTGDSNARPTGKVSLRIGDEWFISPKRKEEERAGFTDARFFHIGSIKKDTTVDFVALRAHAAAHTQFVGHGSPSLSVIEGKLMTLQNSVGTAWENHFGEWLYTDGTMDYLLEKEVMILSRLDWMTKRNDFITTYLNVLIKRSSYLRRQLRDAALQIDNGGQRSTNDHSTWSHL